MNIKSILAATFIAVGLSSAASAETVRIGIATEPYPPFATPDAEGNYVGWEIDMTKAIW